MSQLFTLGGQSIGVLASKSVLPVNTQDWFPLGPHHSAILLLDTDHKNNNHENISSYLCLFQHYLQYPRDENKLNVQWQMNKENVMYIHIHITYTLFINSYTCVCIYIYICSKILFNHIKRILAFVTTQMDPEDIMLCETNRQRKISNYDLMC